MDHSCSCKAGQGICNHKVALMCQAAHYSLLKIDAVPEVPSKTSLPQEWHKPRSAGIHPEAVDNLIVRKPELKSEGGPKCKKRAIDGVKSNLYNPIQNYPNSEFIGEFLARANTDYKETQFATLFSEGDLEYVECNYGTVPKGCVVSYQQPTIKENSKFLCIQQRDTLPALPAKLLHPLCSHVLPRSQANVLDSLKVSLEQASNIEQETKDQSQNPFWHELRKRRLTASKFKQICSRKSDFEGLVSQLKKKTVQTAAMKNGLEHESEAAQSYVNTRFVNVYRTGFVINPGCPFLGTSPDFLVYDPTRNEVFGLLEIKCPQCESCRDAKYLKIVNGQLKLKKTHEYYFQVMGQMAITGLKWCDFMVFCKNDWHIETLYFDEEFFADMYNKLNLFYYNCYLPLIKSNFYL